VDISTNNIEALKVLMETSHPNPYESLPLTPAVFHILLALADEPRHGYGIMKEVEMRTNGLVLLKPGTLYQAIKRLLDCDLIEETDNPVAEEITDTRRRYYRLTDFGRKVMSAEAERMSRLVAQAVAKQVLPGDQGQLAIRGGWT
jgi:DNA-binding PadR family transcriptional regulator